MRVLVACEESQAVTKAFRDKGHEAYSCDLQYCSGGYPEWHYQTSIYNVIDDDWDLIIAHPPCTYLTNSGVCHLKGNPKRWKDLYQAADFFKTFVNSKCKRVAIENPIPHGYGLKLIGRNYSQIIHPWQFGHMEQKATCLWLKNLPPLEPTNNVKKEMMQLSHKERNRLHYLPPSEDRAKLRSKTYEGIALAMAEQWGGELNEYQMELEL